MLKSNTMPLCVASAESLVNEIRTRYGQGANSAEVLRLAASLLIELSKQCQLDREYPLPDWLIRDQTEFEIIDDLVRKAKTSTEPDSPLWILAERVRDIVLKHQRPPVMNEFIDPHMPKVQLEKPAPPKYPLEYFEWQDSKQPGTGWHFTCDIKETKPIQCQTVGYVIKETADLVMIAQTLGDLEGPEEQYIGGVQIVKRSITTRRKLVQLIGD